MVSIHTVKWGYLAYRASIMSLLDAEDCRSLRSKLMTLALFLTSFSNSSLSDPCRSPFFTERTSVCDAMTCLVTQSCPITMVYSVAPSP